MRYLSDDWFAAADAAVRAAAPAPSGPLTIDQRIDGGARWRIQIGDTPSLQRLTTENETAADATFTQSLDTALALAQGTADAHQAFLLGDVRFDGAIDLLIEHRDALAWLEQALAPVMAATAWD